MYLPRERERERERERDECPPRFSTLHEKNLPFFCMQHALNSWEWPGYEAMCVCVCDSFTNQCLWLVAGNVSM